MHSLKRISVLRHQLRLYLFVAWLEVLPIAGCAPHFVQYKSGYALMFRPTLEPEILNVANL